VRGLKSTSPQLSLPVGDDVMAGVWATMSLPARERVLRLLACVIGQAVTGEEKEVELSLARSNACTCVALHTCMCVSRRWHRLNATRRAWSVSTS